MKAFLKAFLLVVGVLIFLINLYVDKEEHTTEDGTVISPIAECDEMSWPDSVSRHIIYGRSWTEYMNNTGFCSQYDITFQDVDDAEYSRNNIYIANWSDDEDYWRQVYAKLYYDNKDHLKSLEDSLLFIREKNQMDRDEFARMVVAFVQDIPYEYVLAEDCKGDETAPCNGNVALGIYSPVEFMGRMHGDCDTRTVLLYTLLRNFGYEPLILNSHEYLHSILALDVASSGDDFEYRGKRYAYWETTNVGWLAGMLPPDMNNKDYWSVALDYEF